MINPFQEVNWNPDTRERQKFARSLLIGCPCVAALMLLTGRFSTGAWNFKLALTLAGAGAGAGVVFLAWPGLARPFYVAWYLVACAFGIVAGNVILGAVFLVLVTGLGLLMRLLGRRAFRKSFDKSAATYWRDAEPGKDPQRYYRQF